MPSQVKESFTAMKALVTGRYHWRSRIQAGVCGVYADPLIAPDRVTVGTLAADNTLVLFTSDNGCAHYIGITELEAKGHFPSGPLRGSKSDAWEGGHRVPFIVRWPAVVKPGSASDALVHQADLIATVAEMSRDHHPRRRAPAARSERPLRRCRPHGARRRAP